MDEAVAQRVMALLAEQALLSPADVLPGMTIDDLGLDSLGLVEAIFAIEEAFDISVPFNAAGTGPQAFDTSSVASVIAAVEALVAGKSA